MNFISIDGDDIGNKIAIAYLSNDEAALSTIVDRLNSYLKQVCQYLLANGFSIIFCGADGVLCKGERLEVKQLANYLSTVGDMEFTFSAGVGQTLQAAYSALKYAKASGKNRVVVAHGTVKFKFDSLTLDTNN